MNGSHDLAALGRRIELAQAEQNASYAAALHELQPELGASALRMAGGVAIYAGYGQVSQAIALGTAGPVSAEELTQVEEHLGRGGAPVQIELLPFADVSLAQLLAQRGYRVGEFQQVLARELSGVIEPDPGPVHARPVRAGEDEVVARVVMEAFLGRPAGEVELAMMRPLSRTKGTLRFIAELDGEVVGGGTVAIHGDTATLAGTGVVPTKRGLGGQAALILARLRAARAQGCTLAASSTHPGTASQRNLEKCGFRVRYCKAVMVREKPPGSLRQG